MNLSKGPGLPSNQSVAFDTVLASTSVNAPFGMPGKLTVNPRYDLQKKVPDATVGYSVDKTMLKMDVQKRQFTLSQIFGKKNRNQVVPTISTKTGDVSVSYSRDLVGSGKVTTTYKPDDSIAVKWTDGDWDATLRAPLEGWLPKGGVKFGLKRNVGVSFF